MARRKLPLARSRKVVAPLLLTEAKRPTTARIIGYARVSTEDQNLDVQLAAMKAAGVQNLFVEKISARDAKRPRFNLMMKYLERGDTLFFHSLSRMGRDVKQVPALLDDLTSDGIIWRSLTEPHLDGTTAMGRFMVGMTAVKDQFESDQITERTVRGMNERKRQGMYNGRPPGDEKIAAMKIDIRKMSAEAVAAKYKVAVETVNQYAPRKRAA